MTRDELLNLDRALSRRAFFKRSWTAAGLVASAVAFTGKIEAETNVEIAYRVMGVMGDIVIPEDQDPGFRTFEPGISRYCLDGFVKHVVLAGDEAGYALIVKALNTMNQATTILESAPPFIEMTADAQEDFFTKSFTGVYESQGYGHVLGLTSFLGLFSAKAVFFSNYPRHLATPGLDVQVIPPSSIKTGFDIMGFKGPISPREEAELRAKYYNIEFTPGVDKSHSLL